MAVAIVFLLPPRTTTKTGGGSLTSFSLLRDFSSPGHGDDLSSLADSLNSFPELRDVQLIPANQATWETGYHDNNDDNDVPPLILDDNNDVSDVAPLVL